MTITTAGVPPTQSSRWKAVTAASIGNALEWFDFVIYGFFAAAIGKLFFPSSTEFESLLVAFATFGITFFVRPLGAILLGVFADRHGRKAALTLSISLMMFGTAVIAVTPAYSTIGFIAPVVIVIARFLQGISAGGEFGSATTFLAEQDPRRRGFYASWQFASQGLTTVLAALFGAVLASALTSEQMNTWGWRIPFVFGLLIGPVALYLRRRVDETEEFRSMQHSDAPLQEALSGAKQRMLVALALVVLCTVVTYTTLFMPGFAARQLGLSQAEGFFATLLAGCIQIVLVPIFGALSDSRGRLPIMVAAALAVFLLAYPMFAWLVSTPALLTLLVVQAVLAVLAAAYLGPLPALMSEMFPPRMRTTGLSVSYSFGVAIFGGFAPFINTWLVNVMDKVAPSYYLMFAAAISLAGLLVQRRIAR
jgi:MHS family proline/betaine transporter-like MFS transporter